MTGEICGLVRFFSLFSGANMAHIRQSRPHVGLDFQVTVPKTY